MIRTVPVFFAVQSTYHTWELDWLDKRDRELEPDEMSIVLNGGPSKTAHIALAWQGPAFGSAFRLGAARPPFLFPTERTNACQ
jgi:hypothetical protein